MELNLLTVKDVAKILNICPQHLNRIKDKSIYPSYIKIGRRIYYQKDTIEQWLKKNEINTESKEQ